MSGSTSSPAPVSEVTADELAELLGSERAPFVLDVREPDEFSDWSIKGARNVPLATLGSQVTGIDPERQIVVVCASGSRSAKAVDALRAAGIEAASLAGGMLAWSLVHDTAECQAGRLTVVQVRRRAKGCLSYVVGSGSEAFVVDPSVDVRRYQDLAAAHGWRITRVFDTHLHADHVSGARALAAAAEAKLHLRPGDPLAFSYDALDAGELALGDASVTVIPSPGHTKGSMVLDLDGHALLTGDTLFVDGVGRPDLAENAQEYAGDLHRSLSDLVRSRRDDVMVFPAHYGDAVSVRAGVLVGASLGEVRVSVPQLSWERDRFVAWASKRATPRPPRFAEIVRVNSGEVLASPDEAHALELGPNRCAA